MYFRARGECARRFFPAPYFFVFCSPNCWNPSLVFLWIALKTVSRLIKSEKRRPLSLQKKKTKTNKQTSAQSTKQRSARVKFVKKFKSLTVKRGRYDNLLWWMAKIYLFSCLIQKVILSGSGSTSCIPAQNGSSGALYATCLIALHVGACRTLASHVLRGSSGARDEPLRTSAWKASRILNVWIHVHDKAINILRNFSYK